MRRRLLALNHRCLSHLLGLRLWLATLWLTSRGSVTAAGVSVLVCAAGRFGRGGRAAPRGACQIVLMKPFEHPGLAAVEKALHAKSPAENNGHWSGHHGPAKLSQGQEHAGELVAARSSSQPAGRQILRAYAVKVHIDDVERHECTVNSSDLSTPAFPLPQEPLSVPTLFGE